MVQCGGFRRLEDRDACPRHGNRLTLQLRQPAFAFDFSVGGVERHQFDSPMGKHANHTTYFDIADEERIVFAYSMSLNGRVHSVSVATVTFADAGGGTRVEFTEQITLIGDSDGAEGRTQGWTALLDNVEKVLTAELPA